MRTTIYSCGCGPYAMVFNDWVTDQSNQKDGALWFPEINYNSRLGPIPRTPSRQIDLVPSMIGSRIITASEHIILAFQKRVRDGLLDPDYLYLFCGNQLIDLDDNGDMLDEWSGGFFPERLSLL